jgi:predicted nuclease of predicted toxin-antitoxin system
MRLLLDECIDEALRHCFRDHDCQTCRYAGLKGLSNGRLLTAAEQAGFEVLITVDKNISHQQRLAGRGISLIILRAPTTTFDDLAQLVPDVLAALETMKPGDVVRIGVG